MSVAAKVNKISVLVPKDMRGWILLALAMNSSLPLLLLAVQYLTSGTYMCASASDDQSLNFCLATGAVFPGLLIDFVFGLKSAKLSFTVAVVPDAGAPGGDSLFENSLHSSIEPSNYGSTDLIGRGSGVYSGGKEYLVCVDIPKAHNDPLI